MAARNETRVLAFDLGASSGRAILGRLAGDRLALEEIHRFPNEAVRYNGELHWDMPRLWQEMQNGLRLAARSGGALASVGVDTWGVDYALLGEHGILLENPYHYRDRRTRGMVEKACAAVGAERIYDVTGIQFMPLNTLFQIYAAAERTPRLLALAERLVTIPDLLNYWLTGVTACEYTIASTTQFLDRRTRGWATDLLRDLGIPTHFLQPI
jgi:rhamnulokinase